MPDTETLVPRSDVEASNGNDVGERDAVAVEIDDVVEKLLNAEDAAQQTAFGSR